MDSATTEKNKGHAHSTPFVGTTEYTRRATRRWCDIWSKERKSLSLSFSRVLLLRLPFPLFCEDRRYIYFCPHSYTRMLDPPTVSLFPQDRGRHIHIHLYPLTSPSFSMDPSFPAHAWRAIGLLCQRGQEPFPIQLGKENEGSEGLFGGTNYQALSSGAFGSRGESWYHATFLLHRLPFGLFAFLSLSLCRLLSLSCCSSSFCFGLFHVRSFVRSFSQLRVSSLLSLLFLLPLDPSQSEIHRLPTMYVRLRSRSTTYRTYVRTYVRTDEWTDVETRTWVLNSRFTVLSFSLASFSFTPPFPLWRELESSVSVLSELLPC